MEVAEYVGRHAKERDEDGHRLVVRNGKAKPRTITTGAGTVEVQAPRINDKRVVDGERQKFTSKILPAYMRKSPKVAEVLPILYLRGLSTNDFRPALAALLGDKAAGLSATAITLYADSQDHAEDAVGAFEAEFAAKHPRAVGCLVKERDRELTLYDFPAEHWKHLRTTNTIESAFATVRLRQRVTKGAGSRTKGISMAFKLLDMAQARWRKLNGYELLPLVRAGVKFVDGIQQERDEKDAA